MSIASGRAVDTRAKSNHRIGESILPGLLMVIAGAIFGDGAALTAAYRGSSPVSDDRLSYPWDGATAVTTSVVWGAAQVLFTVGLVALSRSAAITTTRARRGVQAAVAGSALYTFAHAVSAVAHNANMDDGIGVFVLSCFGIGTILIAIGLLVAGVDVARSQIWSGWRRRAPLALGAWMLAMIPLQFTAALVVAVAVYAIATIALGTALITEALAGPPNS